MGDVFVPAGRAADCRRLPEFEEFTTFQAGRGRMSVRRQGVETTSRALRSEYVSGHYFSTLGVGAFGGRVLTPEDDTPAAAPVAVLSHRAWQTTYGGDTSVVGSTFIIENHPFTIVGVAPPGFFGEMLESDPPDIWVPLQQEQMINGETSLVRQPISAWLRIIGRLKPGATTAGMAPRLTGRATAMDGTRFGLSGELDGRRDSPAAEAEHRRDSRGRRRDGDEGRVRPLADDSAFGVRAGAVDRVRERRQPAAGAIGGAARADRGASGDRRDAAADRFRSADGKHSAGDLRRNRGLGGGDGRGETAAVAYVPRCALSCRSARRRRSWCWHLLLRCRCLPA